MVLRERTLPHEPGAINAPQRVDDCDFALGLDSANLRKNRSSLARLGRSFDGKVAGQLRGGLFVFQRDHGIDLHRATRGDVTREKTDGQHQG